MNQLIEFKNKFGNTLRGILSVADNNEIIFCIHGFERTSTTEKKFKVVADALLKSNTSSFRFDFTGTGLSDGNFSHTTVSSMTNDLKQALNTINVKGKKISVITHSLGACIIAKFIQDNPDFKFKSIVLISPALNQKELLRLWFVASKMKKENPDLKITWENYKDYLNEDDFLSDCERQDKMTKSNYISAGYFLENKDIDYSDTLSNMPNILHVHGDSDDKVPLESLSAQFQSQIIIQDGDHNLERPDIREQWLEKVINFIVS